MPFSRAGILLPSRATLSSYAPFADAHRRLSLIAITFMLHIRPGTRSDIMPFGRCRASCQYFMPAMTHIYYYFHNTAISIYLFAPPFITELRHNTIEYRIFTPDYKSTIIAATQYFDAHRRDLHIVRAVYGPGAQNMMIAVRRCRRATPRTRQNTKRRYRIRRHRS